MSEKPESLSMTEEIQGDLIDHITKGTEGLHIYLKDGRYIRFSAILDRSNFGIVPTLNRDSGFWGRIEEKKEA